MYVSTATNKYRGDDSMTVIVTDNEPVDINNVVTICESDEEVENALAAIANEHEVTDSTVTIYVIEEHISVTQFGYEEI